MASRYLICRTISGEVVPPGIPVEEISNLSWRAEAIDLGYTQPVNAIGKVGPQDSESVPLWGFSFCHVSAGNLVPVLALQNSLVFPDYPLDARMDGMEPSVRAGLVQSIGAYNLDGEGLNLTTLNGDSNSYREFVEHIGQQFEPAFDCNIDFAYPVGDAS